MRQGRFIVIEGIDCSGSTTQTELLRGALAGAGLSVRATKEPTDGPIGRLIRSVLAGRAEVAPDHAAMALLFAADRAEHCRREIAPLLEEGSHVVCDRYLLSSLAYQGLFLARSWIREINRHALAPDLTIYLDIPVEEAMRRLQARGKARDVYETEETLRRVSATYRAALEEMPESVRRIDATQPIDAIHGQILAAVRDI